MRALVLLILATTLLFGTTLKLYLKDGGYHLVREYKVEGDRVRFYSTERSQWEEMPVSLLDLAKTEKVRKQLQESEASDEKLQAEEEAAERALRKEIESVPIEPGAYFNKNGKIATVPPASYDVVTNKRRQALKVLSPVPLVPGKASVVIKGDHATFVVHDDRPTFYFRLEKEERFGIVKLEPKKNVRIVENVSVMPVVNEAVEDRKLVPVFQQELTENLYKVWPEKAIEPGEYAVIQFGDNGNKDDLDLYVWDFAYVP